MCGIPDVPKAGCFVDGPGVGGLVLTVHKADPLIRGQLLKQGQYSTVQYSTVQYSTV